MSHLLARLARQATGAPLPRLYPVGRARYDPDATRLADGTAAAVDTLHGPPVDEAVVLPPEMPHGAGGVDAPLALSRRHDEPAPAATANVATPAAPPVGSARPFDAGQQTAHRRYDVPGSRAAVPAVPETDGMPRDRARRPTVGAAAERDAWPTPLVPLPLEPASGRGSSAGRAMPAATSLVATRQASRAAARVVQAGDLGHEVHVHIGRIDVAVTQDTPARPPRRPRSPEPMSLDDYLARRQGRRS